MVWVRERTIPTQRPPLVGEIIANICGLRVPRGQREGSYGRILDFLDRCRYFSIKSSSVVLTRLSGHRSRPTNFFSGSAGNRTLTTRPQGFQFYEENNIVITYIHLWSRPPLWSSGQSSWLQTQRSSFDSQSYQIFWKVVGLERGPLSLLSTTGELLERNSSRSGLQIREYGHADQSRWPSGILYPQKLALTSPTSGGRLFGIVRWRTQATEFLLLWRSLYGRMSQVLSRKGAPITCPVIQGEGKYPTCISVETVPDVLQCELNITDSEILLVLHVPQQAKFETS
jgi:hypothetical protein